MNKTPDAQVADTQSGLSRTDDANTLVRIEMRLHKIEEYLGLIAKELRRAQCKSS